MSQKLLKIKQIRSSIDVNKNHKLTLRALGLGELGKSKIHRDTPEIRGMIKQVEYLLKVEEVEEEKE
ncbi:MAG TPA: 50S ribosomal protein L30 [Candidatus Hydrothermia bacterium]|nr:50S ribosomal protein L30 [Candidatus Hydrothermae bacterium]MDD3648942.1 50S ribosomal protein L30 [Candidatus Hydrothermia bacterium]MDD5573408.1 50S ribosomal protein L30 [Candidatus Hydrothermia bacterium]HOK23183.1 50S ribosomal protein L30 [Candidatus Hydrothermia bacterium]HOL23887.1 50S ribosomal protein L30 [Candidatus Hydrothermia bacterium]